MGAWGNSIQHTPNPALVDQIYLTIYIIYIVDQIYLTIYIIYIELATTSIFISISLYFLTFFKKYF